MLLEDVYDRNHMGDIKLIFVRFVNEPAKKVIGYEVIENKEFVFKMMLQSITDYTIPKSSCTIYYKMQKKVLMRQFYNQYSTHYYINGEYWSSDDHYLPKEEIWDHIFKKITPNQFKKNQRDLKIPSKIKNMQTHYQKNNRKTKA